MSSGGGDGPGWYPDPWNPGGLRWWDGQQWTSEAAVARADSLGGRGWSDQVGPPQSTFQRYGLVWILAAILGILLVAAVVVVVIWIQGSSG